MARVYVFVEGASDAIALETLAHRRGRDLTAAGIQVVALHGVTNIQRHLDATPAGTRVAGLCDEPELRIFRRAFDRYANQLEVLGCFVCVPDLETELIRAVGVTGVVEVVTREHELDSLRTLQRQPAHRAGTLESQLHRFIGSKSGRKLRYARLLAEELDLTAVPRPLNEILRDACRSRRP
jgi:hypothetical protein